MRCRHSSTADRHNCNLLSSLQELQAEEYDKLTDPEPDEPAKKAHPKDAEPDEPALKAPPRKGKQKQVWADCAECGCRVATPQKRFVDGVEYCNAHGLQ